MNLDTFAKALEVPLAFDISIGHLFLPVYRDSQFPTLGGWVTRHPNSDTTLAHEIIGNNPYFTGMEQH